MIEGQMTLEEAIKENPKEPRCKYCKHWQLLPLNEQTEGWGVKGECLNPNFKNFTTSHSSRCAEFQEWDTEPEWLEEIRQLKNRGKNIYIKESILDIKINLWEEKIYNKNGVEIKGFKHTF